MENFKNKILKGGAITIGVIFILAILYGLSWIVTCGIIKLICMCFGFHFTWKIATGIWLILAILQSVFGKAEK